MGDAGVRGADLQKVFWVAWQEVWPLVQCTFAVNAIK